MTSTPALTKPQIRALVEIFNARPARYRDDPACIKGVTTDRLVAMNLIWFVQELNAFGRPVVNLALTALGYTTAVALDDRYVVDFAGTVTRTR